MLDEEMVERHIRIYIWLVRTHSGRVLDDAATTIPHMRWVPQRHKTVKKNIDIILKTEQKALCKNTQLMLAQKGL